MGISSVELLNNEAVLTQFTPNLKQKFYAQNFPLYRHNICGVQLFVIVITE